ncbi:MAG: hypothetical protein AAGF12_10670 [Myxococcota bacterium]
MKDRAIPSEIRSASVVGSDAVEDAAYRVGYQSPSQFSRDYARTFGKPLRGNADSQ